MLLFSLEKEPFENEFPFIKFPWLGMIKLVYLEFRLGLQFSCPRVKRILHSWSLTTRNEVKSHLLP